MKTFITSCFIFIVVCSSSAQSGKCKLIIHIPDKYNYDLKFLRYPTVVADSMTAMKELKNVLMSFRKASYILASIDSLKTYGKDSMVAYIDPVYSIKWAEIRRGNVSEMMLNKIGFRERFYQKKDFNEKEFAIL